MIIEDIQDIDFNNMAYQPPEIQPRAQYRLCYLYDISKAYHNMQTSSTLKVGTREFNLLSSMSHNHYLKNFNTHIE